MRKIRMFCMAIVLLAMALFSFSRSGFALQTGENILYAQDFNTGYAPEWHLEPGWELAASEDGYALKGAGHVFADLWDGPWQDHFLRFRINLEGSTSGVHANIRKISGMARYFIGFNRQGTYLSKQLSLELFQNNLGLSGALTNGWHTIEISAVGDLITVAVDQRIVIRHKDPEPLGEGAIAFESLGDTAVWIDDVVVGEKTDAAAPTKPSGVPTAQAVDPGELQWVYTGGPLGGLGYDVRMHPTNPDLMYVTDARAGVFHSTDSGKTWQAINNGISVRIGETGELIPIFSLTVDPNNPDILWAGTTLDTGVFKSVDGGESWEKMINGISEVALTLRGFTVDPRSPDIVYTAGEVGSWEWSGKPLMGHEFDRTKGVVYKTTDGGKLWEKIWEGDNLARYIWIDPRNPDIIYVSTGIFDREAANSDYDSNTPGGVGVIKSLDGGVTWQEMNKGLKNLYIGSLFMHPTNPDILLAAAGVVTYNQGSGVYLSEDGGASWKMTLDANIMTSVEFSVSDPNIAYAGSFHAFYRSEDGGKTWRQQTPGDVNWGPEGIAVGTLIDFQVDPRDPERVFVNAYGGGNFVSEDGGITWQNASKGYSGGMVRDIAVDPREAGRVYAGARSGIFVSHNGGEDWTGIATGEYKDIDWHTISVSPHQPDHLLAGITCRHIAVLSENGGETWNEVISLDGNYAFSSFEFALSDPQMVYASSAGYISCGQMEYPYPGKGIFVSQDGGHTWQAANNDTTQDAAVFQLSIHPQDARFVFAATANHGLLKTTDGGQTWEPVAENVFKGKNVTGVRISPVNPNLVFAGSFHAGLLRSEDGGVTWKTAAPGLNPEATVVDVVFDPVDPQLIYLVDLHSGVYRSTNGGIRWQAINKGLAVRAIHALTLTSDGLHLYAASEGQGVFRLDINTQAPAPAPTPTAIPTLKPTNAPAASESQGAATPESEDRQIIPPCLGNLGMLGLVALAWFLWKKR